MACSLMPHEELSLWLQIIFINVVNYFEELSSQGSCGLHNEQYVSTRHVKSPGLMIQQNVIILQNLILCLNYYHEIHNKNV